MPEVDNINEETTKARYITPAITSAGWSMDNIEMEKSITAGRIIPLPKNRSKRDQSTILKADYVLMHNNKVLAIVEAKKYDLSVGHGMQQATMYAKMMNAPFAFSSNGRGFIMKNMITMEEKELGLNSFPSPDILWNIYKGEISLIESEEKVVSENYYTKLNGKTPRYYQRNAIEKVVLSIAKGSKRNILVMATGTGKTYTAFQIIYRLWKSGFKKRFLFLADRNILVDQTKANDFSPFEGSMVKITKKLSMAELQAYEIHLGLYQQLKGQEGTENLFEQYPKDFFDLVIIDECHRGSASADSAWREILNYFSSATHLGLTATPKNTNEAHNFDYFGEPIYTYSLKQGIQDGFLAPYKVVRVGLDKDIDGLSLKYDKIDDNGNIIPAGHFSAKEFNKNIVLTTRDKLVAEIISNYHKDRNRRMDKTIIFCQDIDHAERMRQAMVNKNLDLVQKNPNYVKRITGDSLEKERDLDNFINVKSPYPVIATTSKLMTTGIDAKTCKLIVLDQHIESPTEFKQIVGRGTRINEEYGKKYFDILDFTNATRLFLDPAFDGEVDVVDVEPKERTTGEKGVPVDPNEIDDSTPNDVESHIKYKISDVAIKELFVQQKILDSNGNLITNEYKIYVKNTITDEYSSYELFVTEWCKHELKRDLLELFEKKGIYSEMLLELDDKYKEYDLFDLIIQIAYGRPALTRKQRAKKIKETEFYNKYDGKAREVINELLNTYMDNDVFNLEDAHILKKPEFEQIGSMTEIFNTFNGALNYKEMLIGLKNELYVEH